MPPEQQLALPQASFSDRFFKLKSGMKVILLYCFCMAFMSLCYLGMDQGGINETPLGMMNIMMGFLGIIAFSVSGYWIYHRNRYGAFVLVLWTIITTIQGSLVIQYMFQNPSMMNNSQYGGGEIDVEMMGAIAAPMTLMMFVFGMVYVAAMVWYFMKNREYFTNE